MGGVSRHGAFDDAATADVTDDAIRLRRFQCCDVRASRTVDCSNRFRTTRRRASCIRTWHVQYASSSADVDVIASAAAGERRAAPPAEEEEEEPCRTSGGSKMCDSGTASCWQNSTRGEDDDAADDDEYEVDEAGACALTDMARTSHSLVS